MAAIKVHGNPLSTASMRVLATVYEKEIDHEFVFVDMRAGEHKKEHFLSFNVRKLKTLMYFKHFWDQVQKFNPSIPYKPIIHYNHERKQQ